MNTRKYSRFSPIPCSPKGRIGCVCKFKSCLSERRVSFPGKKPRFFAALRLSMTHKKYFAYRAEEEIASEEAHGIISELMPSAQTPRPRFYFPELDGVRFQRSFSRTSAQFAKTEKST